MIKYIYIYKIYCKELFIKYEILLVFLFNYK